jgi:DNA-binding LacI/PurR family transcriptional regulator
VHIPVADMGLNACRMLLNACDAGTRPVSQKFAPRLALRDSLGPAPGTSTRTMRAVVDDRVGGMR